MICPKCGNENPELVKFCDRCGASLEQGKVCSRCGTKNPQTSKFCYRCGANLDQANVCPKCGVKYNEGAKFCRNCGTKLIQESVIPSDIKPSVEPSVNQGLQPKSRSAALKWGTGILIAITVLYLIGLINLITLNQMGYAVPFLPLHSITFVIAIPAAICAVKRKYWGYVLGATIWLLIVEIIALSNLFVSAGSCPVLPGSIAIQIFSFLLAITCLILISRTKAEFS